MSKFVSSHRNLKQKSFQEIAKENMERIEKARLQAWKDRRKKWKRAALEVIGAGRVLFFENVGGELVPVSKLVEDNSLDGGVDVSIAGQKFRVKEEQLWAKSKKRALVCLITED